MTKKKEREIIVDKHTFVVEISHWQHSSWQGIIKYLEEGREMLFRSAFEMLLMMDEIINIHDNEIDGMTDLYVDKNGVSSK